jgi:DNA adenine methylase
VADLVWRSFGDCRNYVEPFAGSLAVLLARPRPFEGTETVNDADGYVANFWRALAADPGAVAHYADQPVNECDLHARHIYLVNQKADFVPRLEGDPDFFCAKTAGWWCWGLCCWIGSGWCSGEGPWQSVEAEDGSRQLAHLSDAGQGVNRQLAHLSDAGQGVNRKREDLRAWMDARAQRLGGVRVMCGDWSRVCGGRSGDSMAVLTRQGEPTAVFLDPPYGEEAGRSARLYSTDCLSVAAKVREWAIAHGDNPGLRIALCGYEGEHAMPAGWECVPWKAQGGYGSQSDGAARANAGRERAWFSPHCLRPGKWIVEGPLFAGMTP